MDSREIKTYAKEYQGIHTEICNWTMEGHGIIPDKDVWNSYVYIHKGKLTAKQFRILNLEGEKMESFDRIYFEYGELEELFDFNSGITFYEKIFNGLGEVTGFKIGNDYIHAWNKDVTREKVTEDLINTVKIFTKFLEQGKKEL